MWCDEAEATCNRPTHCMYATYDHTFAPWSSGDIAKMLFMAMYRMSPCMQMTDALSDTGTTRMHAPI